MTQWLNGIVASGAGDTANFSAINLTAARTVTLDQPFTIGAIIESDHTNSGTIYAWTLAGGVASGVGGQTLTLSNGYSAPVFTVVNPADTFNLQAVTAGSAGLLKTGLGILDIQAYLGHTGNTILNGGMIQLDPRAALAAGTATAEAYYTNMFQLGDLVAMGGALNIRLGTDQSYYQYFNNLNLTSGDTVIYGSRSSGGQYFEIFTNAIRSAGATVRFSQNTSKTGNEEIFITNLPANNVYGVILPGFGTIGTTDWAHVINTSGEIDLAVPYGPTNFYNTNTTVTASFTVATNNAHTYTLSFNTAAALTLTLNGSNTIDSGGVLVSSVVAGHASTITGGASLTSGNGTDLIVHQWDNNTSGALTIASPIVDNPTNGPIGLTKSGDGALILTAANTYSGATYVNNGTLTVGNGTTVGTLANSAGIFLGYGENTALSAGTYGTIVFQHSDNVSLAAPVSGTGALTQSGSGTLILATNDTYSGATTISSGTLQIGNGVTAGSISNSAVITNNASLVFNRMDNIGYPGVIIGTGSLTQNGSGILALSGVSTYTGVTVVSNGTLQLLSTATTNPISGSSGISVAAGATLDVSAVPSFTLNGSAPSFQALSGSGVIIGSVAAVSGSSVAPATIGTYGTLTFTNNFSLNGGTLYLDVSSNASDLIAVGGNLTLNSGNVTVAVSGTLPNGRYPIITYSGTLSGNPLLIPVSSTLPTGQIASLSGSVAGEVDLVVSGVGAALTWVGDGGNNYWDVNVSPDWSNGSTAVTFNNFEPVTFNDTSANYTVAIDTNVQPASVTVNTANTYTFTDGTGAGGGSIVGGGSLSMSGGGTLVVETIDTIVGPTSISAGSTIQVGNGGTSGSLGSGNITNNGTMLYEQPDNRLIAGAISGTGQLIQTGGAVLALTASNTFSGGTTISSGTLQIGVGGGTGTLGVGPVTNNAALDFNRSGAYTFSGNISGTGTLTNDLGTLTLSGSNSYTGATTINNGTIKAGTTNGLAGTNSVGLVMNGGIFDLNGHNISVGGLTGAGGAIQNNSGSATNILSVITTVANENGSIISDNGGTGGKISLFVSGGGALRLDATSTFSGGTVVDVNTTLSIGGGAAQIGTGGILASNGATIASPNTGSATPTMANNITTASNSVVFINSSSTANAISGQFIGSATSTNILNGNISLNGTLPWSNFLGTVIFTNFNGNGVRLVPGTGNSGSDNTIFDFESGDLYTRNATTVNIGALIGHSGGISGPSVAGPATYIIGNKGLSTVYSAAISGNNNIVKSGAGSLTFNGESISTNTDGATYTNLLYAGSQITHTGNTTVSNGVLALVAPNLLTNSPIIILAGSNTISAVIDASAMGYVSNFTDTNGNADSVLLTNGIFEVIPAETLEGVGTIRGNLLADAESILNPGNITGALTNLTGTGVLTVTNSASIFGAVNIILNRTNTINAGELAAASFLIDPGATLLVTNNGPALQNGDVFHLFNQAVTFTPANITLPTVTSPLYITNKLAVDGTLVVASTVNTTPTNIMAAFNGSTLTLSWPADHIGWRLQTQTNAPGVGLNTNWVTVTGSTNVDSVMLNTDHTDGSVFFRLIYP